MQAVTHSGKFHADDVLAWALLCEFLPNNIELKRTRDEKTIQTADLVFDDTPVRRVRKQKGTMATVCQQRPSVVCPYSVVLHICVCMLQSCEVK